MGRGTRPGGSHPGRPSAPTTTHPVHAAQDGVSTDVTGRAEKQPAKRYVTASVSTSHVSSVQELDLRVKTERMGLHTHEGGDYQKKTTTPKPQITKTPGSNNRCGEDAEKSKPHGLPVGTTRGAAQGAEAPREGTSTETMRPRDSNPGGLPAGPKAGPPGRGGTPCSRGNRRGSRAVPGTHRSVGGPKAEQNVQTEE